MPSDEAESSRSGKKREVERVTSAQSPVCASPPMSMDDLPPYGAQHRQDARWKGGNKALPPTWVQFKVGNGRTQYQDEDLYMATWNRPLPGVRLDEPGDLAPGWEWHISPLGHSYFVDHNTRTTSWKKAVPKRPAGSLTPEHVIEGHSKIIWKMVCAGRSCNILSGSRDESIRQWRRDGKLVGKPWPNDGGEVRALAVSPNETTVVSGGADGKLRLWNIREGSIVGEPWEGHDGGIWDLDWSHNTREIVSGSEDGTIRRWNPDTGQQIGPTIETTHFCVNVVRYSPQDGKFASAGTDYMVRMWSKDGELLIEIKGHKNWVNSLCWSKDGAHIFTGSGDCTIRKWQSIDGKQVFLFRGHTATVAPLCLSRDGRHLFSASEDCSVRIWDLETNQQVGHPLFHDEALFSLAICPKGQYIASAGLDTRIYLWDLEEAMKQGKEQDVNVRSDVNLKVKGRVILPSDIFDHSPVAKQQAKNGGISKYGDDFWGDGKNPALHHPAPSSLLPRRSLFSFLRPSSRIANASQATSLQPRPWGFSLFNRLSVQTVAAARDEDRYGIAPPTATEMAAAMEKANGSATHTPTTPGQGAFGRAQIAQGQDHVSDTGEPSYAIKCCGFVVRLSRQSTQL